MEYGHAQRTLVALFLWPHLCEHGSMATVLFPLPDRDFDVTEFSVPWRLLTNAGHRCVFATEAGSAGPTPQCDQLLLTGVVFGKLGARPEPIEFYRQMETSAEFTAPKRWSDCRAADFDALFLGGGHAPGMKQYLGSTEVFRIIAEFSADANKPIAAICHGVLAAARSKRPDGLSVLHGYTTTCLPKYMERSAYFSTFWRRGRYYRTYPDYVQDEVSAALASPIDFVLGPKTLSKRGTADDDTHAFVVEDKSGRYISSRWPGDAYLLAKQLIKRI
jgi:putative intracellular protease/amidase